MDQEHEDYADRDLSPPREQFSLPTGQILFEAAVVFGAIVVVAALVAALNK